MVQRKSRKPRWVEDPDGSSNRQPRAYPIQAWFRAYRRNERRRKREALARLNDIRARNNRALSGDKGWEPYTPPSSDTGWPPYEPK